MKKKSRFTLIETLIAAVLSGILITALLTQLTYLIRVRKNILQENQSVLSHVELRTRLQHVMESNSCKIEKQTLILDKGTLSLKDGTLSLDDIPLAKDVATFHPIAIELDDDELLKHGVWTEENLPLFVQCVIDSHTFTFPMRLEKEICIPCK